MLPRINLPPPPSLLSRIQSRDRGRDRERNSIAGPNNIDIHVNLIIARPDNSPPTILFHAYADKWINFFLAYIVASLRISGEKFIQISVLFIRKLRRLRLRRYFLIRRNDSKLLEKVRIRWRDRSGEWFRNSESFRAFVICEKRIRISKGIHFRKKKKKKKKWNISSRMP